MDKIIIQGGKRLSGTIPISGAKNSAQGSSVSAEFFAPEMGMVPERRLPPWMMILSILAI